MFQFVRYNNNNGPCNSESVYNLVAKCDRECYRPRYVSMYACKVRQEAACQKKGCWSTMGVPRNNFRHPKCYLKKYSKTFPCFWKQAADSKLQRRRCCPQMAENNCCDENQSQYYCSCDACSAKLNSSRVFHGQLYPRQSKMDLRAQNSQPPCRNSRHFKLPPIKGVGNGNCNEKFEHTPNCCMQQRLQAGVYRGQQQHRDFNALQLHRPANHQQPPKGMSKSNNALEPCENYDGEDAECDNEGATGRNNYDCSPFFNSRLQPRNQDDCQSQSNCMENQQNQEYNYESQKYQEQQIDNCGGATTMCPACNCACHSDPHDENCSARQTWGRPGDGRIQPAAWSGGFDYIERGQKDFVRDNALAAIRVPPRQPTKWVIDDAKGHRSRWNGRNMLKTKNFGCVPEYIECRKQELYLKELEMKRAIEEANPCKHLSHENRQLVMKGLQFHWDELFSEYSRLSIFTSSQKILAQKGELEKQLKELEKDIQIFQRIGSIFVDTRTEAKSGYL